MANEETLRLDAINMHAQGIKVAEIARRLGRSRQWVHKWINRQRDCADGWERSHSNAPHSKANKTSEELEAQVVSSRIRLDASPHMESGAFAIWHDLSARGIEPPSVATINRILKKRGLTRRKAPYQKSGIDYPESPINMQIMDLVGPRYIRGGQRYFLLTIISNDTRHAGVYPILSKGGTDITRSVVAFWKSYTIPDFLQMDNELSFKGSNRHPRGLGMLLRTILSKNVTPIFIPISEPWRNGVIERFNQKVERTLLTQEHKSFEDLQRHSVEFMNIHNRLHHYSTMGHKTPLQLDQELDVPMVHLNADYQVDERPELDPCNLNEIRFIRLVRSDLNISVLNTEIAVIPELMHTYIEAVLLINEHSLLIKQDGTTKQSIEFIMPLE
jgi:transposase